MSDDLRWNRHIADITGCANKLLGLLRQNLSTCDRKVPQYSLDTFRSHFRTCISRQVLKFLEGSLAVVPSLPHEQKQGGKPPTAARVCSSWKYRWFN